MPNEWICTVLVRDIVRWGQSRVHLQIDELFLVWEKKVKIFIINEGYEVFLVVCRIFFLVLFWCNRK